jgi:hypothetical protein
MKTLPLILTRKNVTYRQIAREGMVAVYSYSPAGEPNKVRGYETIIISSHEGYEIAGVKVAPAESYPGDKAFGKKGWSYLKRDLAVDKMDQVVQSQAMNETKRFKKLP